MLPWVTYQVVEFSGKIDFIVSAIKCKLDRRNIKIFLLLSCFRSIEDYMIALDANCFQLALLEIYKGGLCSAADILQPI